MLSICDTEYYNVICMKTHGEYYKGSAYKCKHQNIITQFYQIYYSGESNNYAEPGNYYCDLDYFVRIDEDFKLKYYKERKLVIIINKIFNTNFKENTESYKMYKFSGMDKKLCAKIYVDILIPIKKLFLEELYIYHQSKFEYMLSSIPIMNKMNEHIDIYKRLDLYSELIQAIAEAIKRQNDKAEEESETALEPIIKDYLKAQDTLLKDWTECVDELWK